MTPDQYHLCQLLPRCRYFAGFPEKRFAQHLAALTPEDVLTDMQAAWLLRQAHRYRRQLHGLIEAYTADPALRLALKALCWEVGG